MLVACCTQLVQRTEPEGKQSQGADVFTAGKHPQTESANPTLLKIAALFILFQDLGDFQCVLGE